MLRLEEIKKGQLLSGLKGHGVIKVISADLVGTDALTLVFKDNEGKISELMLFRHNEEQLSPASQGRHWSFDAPAEEFKLALEAVRINMAHLFDPMMAIHTSDVIPLPHQIMAVYEAMLPRQPLRFLLADDPGAGKTIMAGLLIKELIIRGDAENILIVAPGSLVEQWEDELDQKFGLDFEIMLTEQWENPKFPNPFEKHPLAIVRLDQVSRNDDYQKKLENTFWDLVIVDEAHKMSAHYYGREMKRTDRYALGELLSRHTRHFLMMTATPHSGKEEDFQLFLALLDNDRFYGKFRDGVHTADVSDIMRRMVKEELYRFDGTKLFPPRRAETAQYHLSETEMALYNAVTAYVCTEMNKADSLDKQRKNNVGFALTSLQRRLASSPEAIYQSLKRRREKLEDRIREAETISKGQQALAGLGIPLATLTKSINAQDIEEGEMESEDGEKAAEALTVQETASCNTKELREEIDSLKILEKQARDLRFSNIDRKWEKLRETISETKEMFNQDGSRRKMIIFTESKDTLNYLSDKLKGLLGNPDGVVIIYGGTHREERLAIQERFLNEKEVSILVATDAAGEGINLQKANLLINYDLPWNPNRLEQRFGRIHRIGQTEMCFMWNLVAVDTREGEVFKKLFEKLEIEREALGGKVYDVLGAAFLDKPLKDLLIDAIRFGNDPEIRAGLTRSIEGALDTEHINEIYRRNALAQETMTMDRLFTVKEDMDRAEARKLQPFFIKSFFIEAFKKLEGDIRARESERYEITHVPARIRDRDRVIGGKNPVTKKYERICFQRELIRQYGKPMASMVHPGHSLMASVIDLILQDHRAKMKQGTVLVDETDDGVEPRVIVMLEHIIRESMPDKRGKDVVSDRMHFVSIDKNGHIEDAGWAPHLDCVPLKAEDRPLVQDLLSAAWVNDTLEAKALSYAATVLVPDHYDEIRNRREQDTDKILGAVHERLTTEIVRRQENYLKLKKEVEAGKQPRMQPENEKRIVEELKSRLERKTQELNIRRNVISSTPVVIGGFLVIPKGLLQQRRGEEPATPNLFGIDSASRKKIEMIAMQAVMDKERSLKRTPIDVSAVKCGWDITSRKDGEEDHHIEVKGRAKGATTITVSSNEIIYALNQEEKFILAIVLVNEDDSYEGPHYIKKPFAKEPDWGVTSVNYDIRTWIDSNK